MSHPSESAQELFIGVPLSSRSLRAVANAAAELQTRTTGLDLQWVAPARYHLTLKYLGWVKTGRIAVLCDAISAALVNQKPFDIRCRELGGFPNLERAKILWAGIDDRMGEVAALARCVATAVEDLGIPEDVRPFHPHITMARSETGADILNTIQTTEHKESAHVFSKTCVESLILYKTPVESDASEYENLFVWAL